MKNKKHTGEGSSDRLMIKNVKGLNVSEFEQPYFFFMISFICNSVTNRNMIYDLFTKYDD